jgi:hypothetical protein
VTARKKATRKKSTKKKASRKKSASKKAKMLSFFEGKVAISTRGEPSRIDFPVPQPFKLFVH